MRPLSPRTLVMLCTALAVFIVNGTMTTYEEVRWLAGAGVGVVLARLALGWWIARSARMRDPNRHKQ